MSDNKLNTNNKEECNDFWNDVDIEFNEKSKPFQLFRHLNIENKATKEINSIKKKNNKDVLERINKMIAIRKLKEKEIEDKYEKQKEEKEKNSLKECTFHPNINTKYKYQPSNNNKISSFYDRNIKWLQKIKGKTNRLSNIKEINQCDNSYKPFIREQIDFDKLFNNKEMFSYWVRNNRVYLNRHINKMKNNQSSCDDKGKKMKKINIKMVQDKSRNNNNSNCWYKKKLGLYQTINVLHQALINNDTEEKEFNYLNYSM